MIERAIIYLRVSTQEQADSRLGLESQMKLCEQYLSERGCAIYGFLRDEGVSASVPLLMRPSGRSLKECHDTSIIALSLDRLFRNVADYLATLDEFEANGITIHLVDGGVLDVSEPEQWLAQMMKIVFAEYERRMGSRRTRRALKALQDRCTDCGKGKESHIAWLGHTFAGGKVGEPPYGFRSIGEARHEMDSDEQCVIGMIVRWRADEEWSLRRIADELNTLKVPTRDGVSWTHVQIGRILERETTR